MTRLSWLALLGFALVAAPALPALGAPPESGAAEIDEAATPDAEASASESDEDESPAADKDTRDADAEAEVEALEFFSAMNKGTVDVKFIARSDHDARMIITNNTKQPVTLRMPEAFAGVPVVAQFGGGGGGGRGGGGGGRGGGGFGGGGGGGGQQSVGGGGGMMGGGGMGGGGGMFSIPPEETRKINFPVVCLDHGLRNPSSSKPYKIVPADQHVAQPAVVELLKAFGHGKLQHGAAQAAAWNLNNDIGFEELAAKRQGTRRTPSRLPYFSGHEIQAAIAYAQESHRLAAENAEQYRDFGKVEEEDRYGDEAEAAPIEGESTSDAPSEDLATASPDELSASK